VLLPDKDTKSEEVSWGITSVVMCAERPISRRVGLRLRDVAEVTRADRINMAGSIARCMDIVFAKQDAPAVNGR
jgi:hypothetical protein